MFNSEAVDPDDPRSLAMASEEENLPGHRTDEDLGTYLGRVLAWCLEGGSLAKVGFRAHIAAAKLRIDPTGPSLDKIGALSGFGRSAAHRHAANFTEIFGVRGPHDRSEETKAKLSDAWHRSRRLGAGAPKPVCV